ncbi:21604_t:CDS:2 [Gigaspora rosea]|nr:21604_t:CDS:2 [Gigaspora rosea]
MSERLHDFDTIRFLIQKSCDSDQSFTRYQHLTKNKLSNIDFFVMEDSQDDEFFMSSFSSNSSQMYGDLYDANLYNEDLESGEKSDDLDESSEAEKEISSATTRKNEQPLNKSSRKRLPSWTN